MNNGQAAFCTTQWSMVLQARNSDSPAGYEALERLCRAYWYPLYAFVRRKGHSPADAEDLVQGFFEQLLDRDSLQRVEREKGRFRTFLLTSMTYFLSNEWDKRTRQKRGGGVALLSFDVDFAEQRYGRGPEAPGETPDRAFDRAWAQVVFDQVISALREEYRKADEQERFESLKHCLSSAESESSYAELGARLGLSEGGVKTVVRRMRLRFREVLRAQLAETLAEGVPVEDEIREMIAALR